jgi:hypothetical protein
MIEKFKYYSKVVFILLVFFGCLYLGYQRFSAPTCEFQAVFNRMDMAIESESAPINIEKAMNDGFEVKVLCSETTSVISHSSGLLDSFNTNNVARYQFYQNNKCNKIVKYLVKPTPKIINYPTTLCYSGGK